MNRFEQNTLPTKNQSICMCERERENAIYETNIKTNFNCCTVKLVYLEN